MPHPEVPIHIPEDQHQIDGVVEYQPVFDTQRGRIPENHEDKRPTIRPMEGLGTREEWP